MEAKAYFEKYYTNYSVSVNKPDRFVHIKDDGIYSYMYEIGDDIKLVKDNKGLSGFLFDLKIQQYGIASTFLTPVGIYNEINTK